MGLRMTISNERIIHVHFFFFFYFFFSLLDLSIVPFCSLKPNLIKVLCQFCFLKGRKPHSRPLIKILFQYTRYICIPPYVVNSKTLDSIILVSLLRGLFHGEFNEIIRLNGTDF